MPPSTPVALEADLIEIVRFAAAPIPPPARSWFYEVVDRLLRSKPVLGPGSVARACRRAQREFITSIDPAKVTDGHR